MTFEPDDRIVWLHQPRGEYGYVIPADGSVACMVGHQWMVIRAVEERRVWVGDGRVGRTFAAKSAERG
ncbi:MAG: hypothetical protein JO020_13990 [Chloroflexi bacterium]|nr:hypothetical protein [Chloroflexota bacterium]MBV9895276.1 hypothetical protein [Chloroflexota bacterium]